MFLVKKECVGKEHRAIGWGASEIFLTTHPEI